MAGTKLSLGYSVIPILVLFVSTLYEVTSLNVSINLCIKEERITLFEIKKDLNDPGNSLSSRIGKDCCNWIGGELNGALTDLKHLSHLDQSDNDFEGIAIPELLGSLNKLRYLDLSRTNFSGMIPAHLENVSNLHYLDISAPSLGHDKKTRTRRYPSESVPTLTGNTRVDRVWVWVRVFPDNQKSGLEIPDTRRVREWDNKLKPVGSGIEYEYDM
ncbi:receptor-like protein EIX2 [Glycine max]|uniref:receptor-like protein EIX2 n=1 Tax=Glycine max TaxID=3847 RepID=UPI0003DEA402|nr:receptor-like protein EIX2 [Glycine max]|eukprot:XP_006598321.1 receptor-like protein EIX2 [Glycine max]